MHHFQQTSPDSHFTRNTICSKATENGRISLINHRLIETRGSIRHEQHLDTEEAISAVLADRFGIRQAVAHTGAVRGA